jgi:hypothetical protein
MFAFIHHQRFDDFPEMDIIILFHITDHFIVVNIQRSKELDNTIPVSLACSMGFDLAYLTGEVKKRYLPVFLRWVIDEKSFKYVLSSKEITKQTAKTNSDCGVICLQCMHSIALSLTLAENIQLTTAYRCFILFKTIEFKKDKLSQFIINESDLNLLNSISDKTSAITGKGQEILDNTAETMAEDKDLVPMVTQVGGETTEAAVSTSVTKEDQSQAIKAVALSEQEKQEKPETNVIPIITQSVMEQELLANDK